MQNSVEARRNLYTKLGPPVDTLHSSHLKFGAFQKWVAACCTGDSANFVWSVFAENLLMPCIPDRLLWLNNSDIMELFSWKGFITWSIL